MLGIAALVVQCGILADPSLIAAIVQVESGGNPDALAVNGDFELVRAPRNREEAVAMARWLLEHGYSFDAGLAQVNSANLVRLGLDVVRAFEPCSNLQAASRVLGECYERARDRFGEGERALNAALSCYNTGDFTRGVRNGYVAAVRTSAGGSLGIRTSEAKPKRLNRGGAESLGDGRPLEAFGKASADAFGGAARSHETTM
jgi:type IV secretion system protein VirB1